MARAPLSRAEIAVLIPIVREVFEYIGQLKRSKPLAKHIQYPKLPSILSESIVLLELQSGRLLPELADAEFSFGGKKADILAQRKSDSELRIEVKATGRNAFQYFGEKDIGCDFLVWVHFGSFFETRRNSAVDALVIRRPSRHFAKPAKVNLSRIKTLIPDIESIRVAPLGE